MIILFVFTLLSGKANLPFFARKSQFYLLELVEIVHSIQNQTP
jgi:hypothetical protein